jgi:bifunctional UDP-N-acetylglucosamine pyrophosphorylase / glucosamine-1-phosphate N-acetyltransferase
VTGDELTVLILAAGKGTRMKSDLPKVLHKVCGRPMLDFVLDKSERLGATRIITVVGYQAEKVIPVVEGRAEYVLQQPQNGTGHAVMCAAPKFESSAGVLLMLYGDVPLLTEATMRRLLDAHKQEGNKATVLTAILDDPTGYGRIIRDSDGRLDRIVEHKDANEAERAVREINTGICCFMIPELLDVLKEISNDNAQGEYYITDAIGLMRRRGWAVGAVIAADPRETEGINTEDQLARTERLMADISPEN